ncbi:hypothetical protein OG590_40025 (plasmid) [Streptomyces goshikiensis]|uniref:hypothetical protein n=1 Tax=Streptomyces goshikiensis TaxID=1942 RepID=UPI002F9074D7|nr:hypothetical protein OG590_40025 [Streptomyces goshikiensis]
MSDGQQRRGVWTPDLLAQGPDKRRVFIEQRRQYLAPLLAESKALLAEIEADLNEADKLPGDWPFQAKLRAQHTIRPLAKVVADLEDVIVQLTAYSARYRRSYEELPEKRAERAADRQRIKELKAGGGQQQIEAPEPKAEPVPDTNPLFAHLNKGA